jgi:ribosomal protein L44E
MDVKVQAAETWFGYGRWDAPYWFIGKEPGGADDLEQYASWLRLGGSELIDCRRHDLDCPSKREPGMWHGGERPPLQPTWRPLIAMVLAFEGAPVYDDAAVRRYQDERWGRTDGDTAVLELSAIAAPSLAHEDAMRLMNVPERIATFRRHLAETPPRFVVFYGLGMDPVHGVPYLEHWSDIAQHALTIGEPVRVGQTVFVAERHPTAHGTTNEHWMDLGRRVRSLADHSPEEKIPNRMLSATELRDLFSPLLSGVRAQLLEAAGGDTDLHWALRRKLAKELTYDERSKPMQRRALKKRKRAAQENRCYECRSQLPERGAVLDRISAMKGYTEENTRLICGTCDVRIQTRRGYA